MQKRKIVFFLLIFTLLSGVAVAQDNFIARLRPDAPELAALGDYQIGVRTLELVNPGQLNIAAARSGQEAPVYDRPLTVEVWYPATLAEGIEQGGEYQVVTRDPEITATLTGIAVRDADPNTAEGPYPLIVISHGYPGNRFLLSHLGENLATKGYVVVSIDHTDSTYSDQGAFASTLYNRPIDQHFVIDTVTELNSDSSSFLSGIVDTENIGIIGYSMGGYGAVIAVGGSVSDASTRFNYGPPNGLLANHQSDSEAYQAMLDPRVKAVVAFAPWGMNAGFWDAAGLAGIETPMFFVAGSKDDVSGYENGTRAIFENVVNTDRYLLTFANANHNAGAPIPPPVEISSAENMDAYMHYVDVVWDNTRMNNISQHFVTAFMGMHLKGEDFGDYLDLVPDASEGVWSVNDAGNFRDDHTYWKGFGNRTALGLSLEFLPEGE